MTRAAIGTIGTRIAIAMANLLVVSLAAHALGLDGVGRMSLLLLAITMIMLVSNLVGGGGLVYLEPRHGTRTLRWISYGWAIAACIGAYPIAEALDLAPDGLVLHACLLALIESFASIQLTLLLGRERFGLYNGFHVMRAGISLAAFATLLQMDGPSVMDYVAALYIAQGATVLVSALVLARMPAHGSDVMMALIALLRQGIPAQAANGLQLLNYRLSYYLMDRFQGASALGLWSVTTQLAESAWLAPRSLGSVLYARVSNTMERNLQRDSTLAVLKMSVGLAGLAALVLMSVPERVFQWAFGPDAVGIRRIVWLLLPGLLAMAASQAFSHFLSGTGRVIHNTVASGLGVCITVVLGYMIIPRHGPEGAAMTASAAYATAMLYQTVIFLRITKARPVHFLPNAQDLQRLSSLLRRLRGS